MISVRLTGVWATGGDKLFGLEVTFITSIKADVSSLICLGFFEDK